MLIKRLSLLLTVPLLILQTPMQIRNKVTIPIFLPFLSSLRIRIHDPLRHKRQPTQHAHMPLHKVFQRMRLRVLKVVAPIQRVEPRIQQKVRPVSSSHQEAVIAQRVLVLRQDEVDVRGGFVVEGFDYAVRWDDGLVGDHEGFEAVRRNNLLLYRDGGLHEEGVRVEVEEPGAVWVFGHGVPDGWDACPAAGDGGVLEVVVGGAWEEGRVA